MGFVVVVTLVVVEADPVEDLGYHQYPMLLVEMEGEEKVIGQVVQVMVVNREEH